MEARWWAQQGAGQGITYGLSQRLAEYSLIRFSVSASRKRLLTRLPERAVEILGGRSAISSLAADRSIHTLSTGGIRLIRGQALERSAFGEFTESAGRWTGRVGDDYFSHNLSWLASWRFGLGLAIGGDVLIQWFWPGTGDVWNYSEYGLTTQQFVGRSLVAAGGGGIAFGTVALLGVVAFGGPMEVPFLVGAAVFIGVEAVYEATLKRWLYKELNLHGRYERR
jgi:hypothetical protein